MSALKRSLATIGLLLAFMAAGLATAHAQQAPAQETAAAAGAQAAGPSAAGPSAKLDLKAKELDQIERILDKNEDSISKARAEIQILQARVTRLLLEKEPPMDQIKTLVKESLDWELQVRMGQIERQIAIRRVIGEERWATAMKLMRGQIVRAGKGMKAGAAGKEAALLQRVQDILSRLK